MMFRCAVYLSCLFSSLAIAVSPCLAADDPVAADAESATRGERGSKQKAPAAYADGSPEQGELAAKIARENEIIDRYLSLLERNPRKGTTLDRVYGFFVQQGRLDELIDRYRSRVKEDETDGTAWMILGLIEARRSHDAAAIKAFTQASKHRPKDPLAAFYLGEALSIAGRPGRAIAAMEEAISRKPARSDLPSIFVALGRLQGRMGNKEDAGEVWDRLEAAFPGDLRVKAEIASVLANQGEFQLALERYAELAKSAKDDYRRVTYAMSAAEMTVQLGKSDEAIGDYEALLDDLNPESWLFREVRRGIENVFLRTGDLTGLVSYYETWVKEHPEDVGAMTRLAEISSNIGRADEARDWFQKAVRLAPSNVRLRRAYIRALRLGEETEAALEQFEALAELRAQNTDIIRDWGTVYLDDESLPVDERRAQAAAIWKRLLEGDEDDPVVTVQVADWLRQAGMTEDALALYAKAVEQAPDDPRYLEYLGEYQHQLGMSEKAVATWQKLAAGENRTLANLVRLADVLAGFGYKEEAIAAFREASTMKMRYAARLRFAELLREQEQYDAALKQIATAESLAASDEEHHKALLERIKTDRAADRLDKRIAELTKQTKDGENPTAKTVLTLALYLKAAHDSVAAINAARRAVELDPTSIAALKTLAKLADSAGQIGDAATAYRRLAALDRRGRTAYLKHLASLQQRLGKIEEALATGRAVLASAPGNPEASSFYADLCFQSGQTKAGFEALRRAVRFAPAGAGPLLKLASALAQRFRTEEAIALYWQAFEETTAFDDQLPVVSHLAELYFRTDRFEELVDRLRRSAGGDDRETQLLIAEAQKAIGHLGQTRQILEDLLTKYPRDTQLLNRLSKLAGQNGDFEKSLQYQRKIVELAPANRAAKARLARLYLNSDIDAGNEFWDSLAANDLDHAGTLKLIDALLGAGKSEDALRLANQGLRDSPEDWELLYRRAFALVKQTIDRNEEPQGMLSLLTADNKQEEATKKEQAAKTFEKLLALDPPEETKGATKGGSYSHSTAAASRSSSIPSVILRMRSIRRSQMAFGFRPQQRGTTMAVSGAAVMATSRRRRPPTWMPHDYGSARIAAIGWLDHEVPESEIVTELEQAAEKENASAKTLWDWFYLVSYRADAPSPQPGDMEARVEIARRLAKLGGREAALVYLMYLAGSREVRSNPSADSPKQQSLDPLSEEELELMLDCFERVRHGMPSPYTSYISMAISRELKRAGRQEQAREVVRDILAATDNPTRILSLLPSSATAEEVDLDLVDAIFDRLASLPAAKLATGLRRGSGSRIARLMRVLWDAGRHDKALHLLDRQLDLAARSLQARRRSRSSMSSTTRYSIILWKKNGQRDSISIPGSQMTGFLGIGEMTVLLNAVNFYNEDKQLDDLVAHLKKRAESAEGPAAALNYLAVATVLRYGHDDAQALRAGRPTNSAAKNASWQKEVFAAIRKATQAAPQSYALRLTVARRLIGLGRKAEALVLLEEVEPFNVDHLRQRELLVLQLALEFSKIERARQAAKRLFGLQLDEDKAFQLAKAMQQIGMADQAETVLNRLRRGSSGTDTKIKLLRHYQQTGDSKTALEIARTIVQQTRVSPSGRRTVQDSYREEAVRVLKQAGELESLIADARRRVQGAPKSVDARQQLAEYLAAAGKTSEAVEVLKKASKNDPENAQLKYALAGQILAMGDTDEAIDLYKTALKAKPQLLNNDFYQMRRTFEQAGHMEDLLALLGEIDYSASGARIYYATNAANNALPDEKLKDEALTLLDKLLTNNPDQRAQIFGRISNEEAWNSPKILGHALALLKEDGTSLTWQQLGNFSTIRSGGKVTALFNILANAAQSKASPNKFQSAIAKMAEKNPHWRPGQALLAIIEASQGKDEEARKRLRTMLDRDASMPDRAAWAVASELSEYEALRSLAIELAEQAATGNVGYSGSFNNMPGALLVDLYAQAGKKRKARNWLLSKGMKLPDGNFSSNPNYGAYQEMRHYNGIANKLIELGYPIDALRIFNEYSGDPPRLAAAKQVTTSVVRQLEEGRKKALKQITPANVAAYFEAAASAKETPKAEAPPLDLMLTVTGDAFSQLKVNSVIVAATKQGLETAEETESAAKEGGEANAKAIKSIQANIASLANKRPDDLAVQTVAAVAAYALGDIEAAGKATKHLAALTASAPTSKAMTLEQKQAAWKGRVALWLVAREAARSEDTQTLANDLADRALAAAKHLTKRPWAAALLRERGQSALEAGHRAAAKKAWSQALEVIIPEAKSAAKKPAPRVAPKPDQAAGKAAKTSSIGGPPGLGTTLTLLLPAQLLPARQATTAIAHPATPSAQPTKVSDQSRQRTSFKQAKQALELAELAAKSGMPELSFRAVRASLAGGRPLKLNLPTSNNVVTISPNGSPSITNEIDREIARRLFQLDNAWRDQTDIDPAAVYEVLVAASLPAGHPRKTLLYAMPIGKLQSGGPRSIARVLVDWAERAGKLDALAEKLEARATANPQFISVHVLRTLTALKSGNMAAAKDALSSIAKNLAAFGSTRHASMALHAALPAFSKDKLRKAAVGILTLAVAKYADAGNHQLLGDLSLKLAKYNFQHNRPDEAVKILDDYLAALPRIFRNYDANYATLRRREALVRVAQLLASRGRTAAALDRLSETLHLPVPSRSGGSVTLDQRFLSGLSRQLAAEESREAYEHLKAWTLPSEKRNSVWLYSAISTAAVPPGEFDIPRDPARSAFGSGRAGIVTGTAVALIALAKRHEDLAALTAKVDQLAAADIENAAELSILLHCAVGTGAEVANRFAKIVETFVKKKAEQTNFKNQQYPLLLLLAEAATADPALRANARTLIEKINMFSRGKNNEYRTAARLLAVECAALEAGLAPADILPRDSFGPWAVARFPRREDLRRPRVPAIWAVRNGVARHLAGSRVDPLVFRSPLTGSFDLYVDAYDGSWGESQIGFGGLVYKAIGWTQEAQVANVGASSNQEVPFPSVHPQGEYNTVHIQVRPGSTSCFINGEKLHTDEQPSGACPFLILSADFGRNTAFRDIRITGDPVIPREVRLIGEERLDGWSGQATRDTKSQRPGLEQFDTDHQGNPTWSVTNGVATARRRPPAAPRQSLLSYRRPLFDGESVTYEFRLGGGDHPVHPALGRLVFLLKPEGVRLHWVVAEIHPDWTGLGPGNEVAVSEHQRGPRPLTLKRGQWNRVRLSLNDGLVRIELNGELVFARPLGEDDSRVFGLFHYAGETAHIRNIVLRGDWPKRLDDQTKAGLLRAAPTSPDEQLTRFEREIITEEHLRRPAWPRLNSLSDRAPAARYDELLAWVLPTAARSTWRLGGAFSPADPPPGLGLFGVEPAPEKPQSDVGGRIVSAAGLLVSTAAELGKLNELSAKVDVAEADSNCDRRCQLAMQVLVATEKGETSTAAKALNALLPLLKKVSPNVSESERWPELLAANAALNHPALYDEVVNLLNYLVTQQVQMDAHDSIDLLWRRHVRRLRGEAQTLAETDLPRAELPAAPPLKYWRSAAHERAGDRAAGRPRPLWQLRSDDQIWHRGGPHRQFLYLTVPVQGDFEVSGEFRTFAWREMHIRIANLGTPPRFDKKNYLLVRYGRTPKIKPLPQPITFRDWNTYRAAVKEGVFTSWVNGIKIHEETVGESFDPWVAIAARGFISGGMRNVTITGAPTVPEEINLLTGEGLGGWRLYYPGGFTGEWRDWRRRGEEIYGLKEQTRSINQTVLFYHRPMFEDGEISYEFYYDPHETLVHPALDRLVFLLDPEGVKIHWLTDGAGDRTGLGPRNVTEASEYQRGPEKLPLEPHAWNRLTLSVKGNVVTIVLNDQTVFERPLESTNQRAFGFFRYIDKTAARIRDIRYRGDWPKKLPPAGELFSTAPASEPEA